MKHNVVRNVALASVLGLALPWMPLRDRERTFELEFQNLAHGQVFSPPLVAVHGREFALFRPGHPASPELALLAEEGDNTALLHRLERSSEVADVQSAPGVLPGGETARFRLRASSGARYLSLAAMLVQTNDGFAGLDRMPLPKGSEPVVAFVYAWDAGTEANSESCQFVPGPPCGAAGAHDPSPAEGFVHLHNGIHGHGDLDPAVFDWRGPVARVVLRRVGRGDGDDDDHDD